MKRVVAFGGSHMRYYFVVWSVALKYSIISLTKLMTAESYV